MIASAILQILVTLSAMLAGLYLAIWRVKRQLRPTALLLDEGLKTLQGGIFQTAMAKGHLHGRPVGLRIHVGRWSRTLYIRMACDSPLDFTIWTPGRQGASKTVSVDGYLVLAGPEFNQEFASISPDPSRFLAWARQPLTKDRLNTLSNAKDNWRLELRSGTLELTDFACR